MTVRGESCNQSSGQIDVSLTGFLNGGALTTCFSIFSNFRYPGGFLGGGFFSSTALLSFCSDITPPPGRSARSTAIAFQRWSLGPSGIVERPYHDARCSGSSVRQGNDRDEMAQHSHMFHGSRVLVGSRNSQGDSCERCHQRRLQHGR